jgi:hypothetical protein
MTNKRLNFSGIDQIAVGVDIHLNTVVAEEQVGEEDYGEGRMKPIYEPVTLLDIIIESAARQLVDKITRDADWGSTRDAVLKIRRDIITEAVTPSVMAALEAPLRRTNTYGEPFGVESTMREILTEEATRIAQAQLKMGDRFNSSGSKTAMEKVLSECVAATIEKELRMTMEDAKKTVRDKVATSTSEVLAKAITDGVTK